MHGGQAKGPRQGGTFFGAGPSSRGPQVRRRRPWMVLGPPTGSLRRGQAGGPPVLAFAAQGVAAQDFAATGAGRGITGGPPRGGARRDDHRTRTRARDRGARHGRLRGESKTRSVCTATLPALCCRVGLLAGQVSAWGGGARRVRPFENPRRTGAIRLAGADISRRSGTPPRVQKNALRVGSPTWSERESAPSITPWSSFEVRHETRHRPAFGRSKIASARLAFARQAPREHCRGRARYDGPRLGRGSPTRIRRCRAKGAREIHAIIAPLSCEVLGFSLISRPRRGRWRGAFFRDSRTSAAARRVPKGGSLQSASPPAYTAIIRVRVSAAGTSSPGAGGLSRLRTSEGTGARFAVGVTCASRGRLS